MPCLGGGKPDIELLERSSWQGHCQTTKTFTTARLHHGCHQKTIEQVFPARMRENLAAAGWPEPDPSLDAGIEALLARAFPTQGEP